MLSTIYSAPQRKHISDRLVKIGKTNWHIYSKNLRYTVSSRNSLLNEFVVFGYMNTYDLFNTKTIIVTCRII